MLYLIVSIDKINPHHGIIWPGYKVVLLVFSIFSLMTFSLINILSMLNITISDLTVFMILPLKFTISSLLFYVLNSFLPESNSIEKTFLNEGIKVSLKNSVSVFFLTLMWILTNMIIIIFTEPSLRFLNNYILIMVYVSFCIWLFNGGLTIIQHYSLRLTLFISGCFPLNIQKFLKYSSKNLFFMYDKGNEFSFIHRYLLEYFAALYEEKHEKQK